MSHFQQVQFVKEVASFFNLNNIGTATVLEIGSYDVNGSIRNLFPSENYTGVDLTDGPGVDIVCSGDKVDLKNNSVDVVISCEVFEHAEEWNKIFDNMYRMLKPGGLLIMTCASTGRLEHGTQRTSPFTSPGTQSIGLDYYKNISKTEFRSVLNNKDFDFSYLDYNKFSFDLYFVGKKRLGDDVCNISMDDFKNSTISAFQESPAQKNKFFILRAIKRLKSSLMYALAFRLSDKAYQNTVYQISLINKPFKNFEKKIRPFLKKLKKN